MSDTSQGAGWWQASDGNWYAPETHPEAQSVLPEAQAVGGPDPKQPWYKRKGIIALGVGAVILVIIVAANAGKKTPDTTNASSTQSTTALPATAPPTTAPPATAPPTTAAPTPTAPPTTTAPPPPPAPALSNQAQNAVREAKDYLNTSDFSRQGLIDQLDSSSGSGYSVADATAAVDSLNIDYNAQAVKSAKAYLGLSGFSCQGLIDQLDSTSGSQYTVDQATYGAQQAGAC